MKNRIAVLAGFILFTYVSIQAQTTTVEIENYYRNTNTRTIDDQQKPSETEGFTKECWQIKSTGKNTYDITLTESWEYSRYKNEYAPSWRSVTSNYSFLPGKQHPLLNHTLTITVDEDSVRLYPKNNELDLQTPQIKANIKTLTERFFLYFNGIKKENNTLTLLSKSKNGIMEYGFIDTDEQQYQKGSVYKVMPKNKFGHDVVESRSMLSDYTRNEWNRTTQDSTIVHYEGSHKVLFTITTTETMPEAYTVHYRDENFVIHDSTYQQTNVRFRGKIANFDPNSHISIDYYEDLPGMFKRKAFVIYPEKDGSFEIRLWLNEPMAFTFWHHEVTPCILAPGDDIYLTLDMSAFDESIKYTGTGSGKNQFLANKFLYEEEHQIRDREISNAVYEKYKNTPPDAFATYIDSVYALRNQFIHENMAMLTPESYLRLYYNDYLNQYSYKNRYTQSMPYYRKQANEAPFEIPENYTDFKKDFHADNDLMSFAQQYEYQIRNTVFFDIMDKFRDNYSVPFTGMEDLYKNRVTFTEMVYSGITEYYLKYITLGDVMKNSTWELAQEMMNDFKRIYPNTRLETKAEIAYAKAETVAPGSPAFDFELEDLEGNLVHLSDFKGKVVYLDFWGTGCGPCRYQIENYSAKLKERMKGTDVVFMYIACEGNTERVKKYMEENHVTGVLLIAKNKEALIRDKYWFNGIPKYYIIGRDGQIVQNDAPRPSELLRNDKPLQDALNEGVETAYKE